MCSSIPALLGDQATPEKSDVADIRLQTSAIFGLDNSAPFPLMSQHHLHSLTQDILNELPSDREVMKCVDRPSSPISHPLTTPQALSHLQGDPSSLLGLRPGYRRVRGTAHALP